MKCPKCHSDIAENTTICPHCHKVLSIVCPNCRTLGHSAVCKNCGYIVLEKCPKCGKYTTTTKDKCSCGLKMNFAVAYQDCESDEFASINIKFNTLKEIRTRLKTKEVFKKFVHGIAITLEEGKDIIADATHLNMFSRCKLIQALDMYTRDYDIVFVVFNTDVETCVERNKSREGRRNVPENIIRNMCRDFRAPTLDEDERVVDIITVTIEKGVM